ncbi:MAG: phosphoribosylamine--glycine ligase [Clostridia bacterium]|nr:phosphoribosylamine--glycine ligase [Clostridia bacterium]
MKVLVVGGGGREHAIIYKLKQNKNITEIHAAPGNGGISDIAICHNIKATDIKGVLNLSKEIKPDMVVVAPDDPLMLGMVDELNKEGIRAFGPCKNAAIIEGSKVFAKELMKKYNIPTAGYEVFEDSESAINYIKKGTFPAVIKAEGLALGKGVIIAENFEDAENAVHEIMDDKIFGDAGNRVVVEEFLTGPEVSVLAFTDGKTIIPMPSAQDHKRAYDNDKGKNTGGMGTFSPSRIYDEKLQKECMEKIFVPTMNAMNSEGRKFKGVLFFGLMITEKGPKVIEYNCRFGDPETQSVLLRLESDLYDIFDAIIDERLDKAEVKFDDKAAVCIVMASGGYPEKYQTGFEIDGLLDVDENTVIFHAGTKKENGKYYTAGGRVLGVTAKGENLDDAIKKAYENVSKISFEKAHYRKDIGIK